MERLLKCARITLKRAIATRVLGAGFVASFEHDWPQSSSRVQSPLVVECILTARIDEPFGLNTTALNLKTIRSSEMSIKSIAGRFGERRAWFALSSGSASPLAGRWSVSDFVSLTKPRVMMLAVFTALVGMSIAPCRLDPVTTFAAVLAIAAGAGAAGVYNMWYDADIDAVMTRTAMRPIPRGKISRFEALDFIKRDAAQASRRRKRSRMSKPSVH